MCSIDVLSMIDTVEFTFTFLLYFEKAKENKSYCLLKWARIIFLLDRYWEDIIDVEMLKYCASEYSGLSLQLSRESNSCEKSWSDFTRELLAQIFSVDVGGGGMGITTIGGVQLSWFQRTARTLEGRLAR
jgi:hypothetical protein